MKRAVAEETSFYLVITLCVRIVERVAKMIKQVSPKQARSLRIVRTAVPIKIVSPRLFPSRLHTVFLELTCE